jgi:hypothetical protein
VDSFDKTNAEMVLFDVANSLMTNKGAATRLRAPNEEASDSATYQNDLAQPPGNALERQEVSETRRRLTQDGAR